VDWDAERYHRLSEPQVAWGRRVLERLAPRAGERVLDLGCGTGRLTADIAARTGTLVVGADRSPAMVEQARVRRAPHTAFVLADGVALPFAGMFDAVFSAATFHWIEDHERLFRAVRQALRPGGRLVAQCGGGPNLSRLLARAHALMDSVRFNPWFGEWRDPWNFAGVDETRARMEAAGFTAVDVSLEPAPTTFPDALAYADFISCVCVRHHVDKLPSPDRAAFVAALAEQASGDDPPYTLDYWRLNMAGTRKDT
jgi:trans-aconitate 2-methyltransferase